jgi:hypothetical protein
MPNYTESRAYAEERLARIQTRYSYHYSRSYYIRRACDSATRRMTNQTKLQMWAAVLETAGLDSSASLAYARIAGLQSGSITPQRRRRLGRTAVPAYAAIEPLRPNASGVSMVTYEFTVEAET